MEQHNLHHLETASTYAEHIPDTRHIPPIPLMSQEKDGLSTPQYDMPNLVTYGNSNQIVLGGLIAAATYDGTTDPREWVNYYNEVASANGWSTDIKFRRLISALEGSPLLWYRNQKLIHPSFNYEDFSKGLIAKYTNECDQSLAEINIMRRKQREDESLNLYWDTKVSLMEMTCVNMSEETKVLHLFNGLNENLYNRLIAKFIDRKPKTVEDLWRMVKRTDDAISFTAPKDANGLPLPKTDNKGSQNRSGQTQNRPNPRMDNQIERLVRSVEGLSNKMQNLETKINRNNNEGNYQRSVRFTSDRNNGNNGRDFRLYQNRNFAPNQSNPRPDNNGKSQAPPQPNTGILRAPRDMSTVECYECHEIGHYATACPKRIERQRRQKNENSRN